MANPEHLEILKQGVKAWNKWREANHGVLPDLNGADLGGADLSRVDLTFADLGGADLSATECDFTQFLLTRLNGANFTGAQLAFTNFTGATLGSAVFTDVVLSSSWFADNDLSRVKGLKTVRHIAPSYLGIDTVYKSQGKIPEIFLRGCGVPEPFIVQIPSLVTALDPIQFYSCFISYSSKDQDFAEHLHADLQYKGVRCWFAPEDLKIGDRFRDRIDESIRLHDKLLLILSEHSVSSPWVSDEVEAAIEREHMEGRTVLFPIKIDDAVMESEQAWAAAIRRTRHIGDFTRWKDHESYRKAFERLLRDLKAEEKKS